MHQPDYLSEEIVVRLRGDGVAHMLDAVDKNTFEAFLLQNSYDADTTTIKSHTHLLLNSFQICTRQSEALIQTSDSVIYARLLHAGDERSQAQSHAAFCCTVPCPIIVTGVLWQNCVWSG